MKQLPVWVRLTSALAAILLLLTLTLTSSTPPALAYSCGDLYHEDHNCYADTAWPGNVDGAASDITISRLSIDSSDIVANFIWLKDTNDGGVFPTFRWFEAGYYAYDSTGDFQYYFANEWDLTNPDINYICCGSTDDYGKKVHVEMSRSSGSQSYFVNINVINGSLGFTRSLSNQLNPSYIFEGQRLTGVGTALALESTFNNNQYYYGNQWYPQNNPGNPPNGYINSPLSGWWRPQPDSGNSGIWHTGYLAERNDGAKPGCRWPHTTGQYTNLGFVWGSTPGIQPGMPWRTAFQAAINNWNYQAATRTILIQYINVGSASITMDTYNLPDDRYGKTEYACNGSTPVFAHPMGNLANEPPDKQTFAGHEAGHGFFIGHIDNPPTYPLIPSLMGFYNPYNTPQPADTLFVNQFYP